MSATPTAHPARFRRRWALWGGGGLLLILVALGLSAVPFLGVPDDATAAQHDLEQAMSALKAGDFEVAEESVAGARSHADDAQDATHGFGGDLWSALPWVGSPVDDARHLTQALDDLTAAAEQGVAIYPLVAGDKATLLTDGQVDEDTLGQVLDGARSAGANLLTAREELESVEASFPVVGETIAANRDAALEKVAGPADAWQRLGPALDQVPGLLGFEGRRTYLIAMLNPAELRYSGGAPLAYAPMKVQDGKITTGASRTVAGDPALQVEASWPRVKGNKFHDVRGRVSNSTFAPSWSVAGEELLRAWKVTHDRRFHGVIAADVVAMAGLLGTTEGVEVPGYGTVTSGNLVQTVIGSYDQYYPDPNAQDDLNRELIPAFKSLMFEGGGYMGKMRALSAAAQGRHFAVYLRDDDAQSTVKRLGVDGDLAEPRGDYLGVFTQNINGSKVDYFQSRQVALDVVLDEEGASRNTLVVGIDNDTPPSPLPVPDPQFGYFTRYAELNLAAFVPADANVLGRQPGQVWSTTQGEFYDHNYSTTRLSLEPSEAQTRTLSYAVPTAAEQVDGGMVYRLTVDPQGTVRPQATTVKVKVPAGYRPTTLPEGWSASGRQLRFHTETLTTTTTWEIPLSDAR